MYKTVLFLLLLPLGAWAAIFETGAGFGPVFMDRGEAGGGSENPLRLSVYGGYQFNAASDQIVLSLVTDSEVDEIQAGYVLTLPSLMPYSPFTSLPYAKASLGLGNTYAQSLTLTHASLGAAFGAYGNLTNRLRLRFELEYRLRDWQLDRSGEGSTGGATVWEDSELGIHVGLGYLF
ncbi:MAG: hypothetical protein AB7E49_01580 [Campylobacterales bacterium]